MDKVSASIGSAIRSMRKMRGLSQSVLARRVDLADSTISNIECGMPSTTRTINKIARALGFEAHVTFRQNGNENEIIAEMDDPRQMKMFEGAE